MTNTIDWSSPEIPLADRYAAFRSSIQSWLDARTIKMRWAEFYEPAIPNYRKPRNFRTENRGRKAKYS